jgi:hypothetical protein
LKIESDSLGVEIFGSGKFLYFMRGGFVHGNPVPDYPIWDDMPVENPVRDGLLVAGFAAVIYLFWGSG